MLDSIRSGAQSWGVKIAFGLIILVFVFWGVGNFNDRDYSNVVAVVNGEPIVALEFEKAYHNAEEYLLRNNPGLTREQLTKGGRLGRQVLNDLIRETLIAQEAKKAGIVVTPQEMRLAVSRQKAFQNEAGQFDPEAYKRVLAARRVTPAQYEADLANQLLQEKVFALVTAPVWTDPEEPLNRFNFLRERRIVDYIFLPAKNFLDKVKVSEAEENEWYETHKADFAIPPMVDVSYLLVAPENLVNRADIPETAARAWYEANKGKFERPERVHARHILVALPKDADEAQIKAANEKIAKIRKELDAGKPFAAAADEYNEPNAAEKGGDLGWIGRGQTIPEFENVVFALPAGKVSEPLRTPFGLHLALVEEKQEAGAAPFDQVRDEAYKAVAFEEGSEKLHEVLDNLIEDNILGKPLEEAGARYNLKPLQTGLADKNGLAQKLGIRPEAAEGLLAAPAGSPLDTAIETGDNYIIARIAKSEPASVKPFDDVKAEIRERLAARDALDLAMAEAKTLLEKIKNETPRQVREQNMALKTSDPIERGASPHGFAPNEALADAIFDAKVGTWLAAPEAVKEDNGESGALLAYVDKLVPPGEGEFEAIAEILGNAGKQERIEGMYGLFIQNLADNAKIQITNQDFIDRVNM